MTEQALRIEDVLETAVYELDVAIAQEQADTIVEQLRTKKQRALREDALRQQLSNWYRQRKMRDRRINFRNLDFDYELFNAAIISVEKLTEHRSFKRIDIPYRNQSLPAPQTLEQLWDQPISKEFCEDAASWTRAGSQRVEGCPTCKQKGKVRCRHCHGSGEDDKRCSDCGGSGSINDFGHDHDKHHSSSTRTCSTCDGRGRIETDCNWCKGRGEVECSTCEGERRVYTYEEIAAQTNIKKTTKLVSPNEHLKLKWAKTAPPVLQLEHTFMHPLSPPFEANSMETGKRYELQLVDIHRITFFHRKEQREIFIMGKEVEPVDGSYLYDWRSIIYLSVGVVVLIVMIYLFATYL